MAALEVVVALEEDVAADRRLRRHLHADDAQR